MVIPLHEFGREMVDGCCIANTGIYFSPILFHLHPHPHPHPTLSECPSIPHGGMTLTILINDATWRVDTTMTQGSPVIAENRAY